MATDVAAFVLRLGVGSTFLLAGLEKVLLGPEYIESYFSSLSIAAPGLIGPMVAAFELVGGAALILGLFTRLFAATFVLEMVVAIAALLPEATTARSVVDIFRLFRLELLLMVASAGIAFLGPGRWTLPGGFVRLTSRTSGPRLNGTEDSEL